MSAPCRRHALKSSSFAVFAAAMVLLFQNCTPAFNVKGSADSSIGGVNDGTAVSATPTPTPTPTPTADVVVSKKISGGDGHTCAVAADKTVWCWGKNPVGQLGNGTTVDSRTPVHVVGLTDIESVLASENHSCALNSAGQMFCWGGNDSGQLGIGQDGGMSLTPARVPFSKPFKLMSSNGLNMCAATLKTNEVYCWGWAALGELGDASNPQPVHHPSIPVPNLRGKIVALSSSWHNHCAVNDAHEEFCWGDKRNGRLGDGVVANARAVAKPILVSGRVQSIANFGTGGCAVLVDGTTQCWGEGDRSQLAQDTDRNDSAQPVNVKGLLGVGIVRSLSGGWGSVCVLLSTGHVRCWGASNGGTMGNSTYGDSGVAVEVANLPLNVSEIDLGWFHACAITTDSKVFCWGANPNGQIGNGTTVNAYVATPVSSY